MVSVVENSMVCSPKINLETKALVRLLRVEGGLSIRQIVGRCKISGPSVYRCLNGRNVQKLRKEEGNFSCHCIRAESDLEQFLFGPLIGL